MRLIPFLLIFLTSCANVSLKHFKSNECAFFENSFDDMGMKGVVDSTIDATCELSRNGATCTATMKDKTSSHLFHFKGPYQVSYFPDHQEMVIEAKGLDVPATLRLFCTENMCKSAQIYSPIMENGFACLSGDLRFARPPVGPTEVDPPSRKPDPAPIDI